MTVIAVILATLTVFSWLASIWLTLRWELFAVRRDLAGKSYTDSVSRYRSALQNNSEDLYNYELRTEGSGSMQGLLAELPSIAQEEKKIEPIKVERSEPVVVEPSREDVEEAPTSMLDVPDEDLSPSLPVEDDPHEAPTGILDVPDEGIVEDEVSVEEDPHEAPTGLLDIEEDTVSVSEEVVVEDDEPLTEAINQTTFRLIEEGSSWMPNN